MDRRFSIVLASRERVNLLQQLLDSLMETTKDKAQVEILVGCDLDDTETNRVINDFTRKYRHLNLRFCLRQRSEWMHRDYLNWLFGMSHGKYVIILNDDTKFITKDWDERTWNKLEAYIHDKPDGVVYGFTDNLVEDKNLCCFPLLSRKGGEALGFLMHNERMAWGADREIHMIYSHPMINRICDLRDELKIEHIAYHHGKRGRDSVSYRIEKISGQQLDIRPFLTRDIERLTEYIAKSKSPIPPKNKVLVVYNICGISNRENTGYYVTAIDSILNQKFPDCEVVVSGCCTSSPTKMELQNVFGSRLSYNWIDETLPLGVTFNHTVQTANQKFGIFDSYLFVDSGVFLDNRTTIQSLYDNLKAGPYAMMVALVDTDGGYDHWGIVPPTNHRMDIPVGRAVNLHCQLFSRELLQTYGNLLPDVFANNTSESIFTFLCAAIHKKWGIAPIRVHHRPGMDGPSSGFPPARGLFFRSKRSIDDICKEGRPLGFGYEEVHSRCVHIPEKFDENGFANDPRLQTFLRNNLYTQDFDYSAVQHSFRGRLHSRVTLSSPKITCLLVSHNKPKLLKETIDSLLKQELTDWEAVIVDSGILYDQGYFSDIKDSRIRVIRSDETPEMRKSKAMAPWCFNECFRRSLVRSKLVVYLCDDDIFYPNAFETFVQFAENNPQAMAMYASEDMAAVYRDGSMCSIGERRATVIRGRSHVQESRGRVIPHATLDCQVDYLQFCHRIEMLALLGGNEWWSEAKHTERHADGVFMDRIGDLAPVYPIDIKIGQNRRTSLSTYDPLRDHSVENLA